MSIGDTITEPIPPVSTPGTGYASQLVAFLEEVKARLEAKVPLSSLLAGLFDLDNNAIENIQYGHFYEQLSSPTTPVGSLQNYQGNLWWVSSAGAAQITSGNALNAASLGAIDGDYGGVNPASLRFVDADETFYFYDDYGALKWARLSGRSIDIHGGATETDRVRITWAGSSSYTLTLPDSPPASTAIMQMDSSGNVTASNTIANPTVFSDTVTVNSTVSVSSRSVFIGPAEMQPRNDSGLGATMGTTYTWIHNTTGASSIFVPIKLPVGAVIGTVRWYGYKGSATGTISAGLRRNALNGSGDFLIASVGSNSANNPGAISFENVSVGHTVLTGSVYYVQIATSGQANDETFGVEVAYSGVAL